MMPEIGFRVKNANMVVAVDESNGKILGRAYREGIGTKWFIELRRKDPVSVQFMLIATVAANILEIKQRKVVQAILKEALE